MNITGEILPMAEKFELAKVFTANSALFKTDKILCEAIDYSVEHTKVYHEDFAEEVNVKKAGNVKLMKGRTLQTALKIGRENPGKKIAVLNFAASQNPGGGIATGSRAQEESICRSSTLYPTLVSDKPEDEFYYYHRNSSCGYKASDRCIYSPDVVIFRDDNDEIPAKLRPEEYMKVDVITCAAPHIFKNIIITAEELFNLHVKRAKNILRVSAFNNVDILITGAFGCGAFHNDPFIVAWAWREAMKDYQEKFDSIIFAIYSHPSSFNDNDGDNFRAFRNEFTNVAE